MKSVKVFYVKRIIRTLLNTRFYQSILSAVPKRPVSFSVTCRVNYRIPRHLAYRERELSYCHSWRCMGKCFVKNKLLSNIFNCHSFVLNIRVTIKDVSKEFHAQFLSASV